VTVGEFAEAAYIYCLLHGASTTSGVRSTARNTKVGGVPFSPHRFGRAMDVVYDDLNTQSDPARLEVAQRLGLNVIPEGDHDHLQPLDWAAG
jgi:hypothetical protein